MTLVVTVTKQRVSERQTGLYNITLNMIVTDGGKEVINKDYSARYRPHDTISTKLDAFTTPMQKDIDVYKSEQLIYKKAAIGTLVTNVKNALVV